ncbi:MAG: alpha-amylase family glycosyl hydrolase [Flavobacteriales bacterium]|jgi:cyclomaltodextrinase
MKHLKAFLPALAFIFFACNSSKPDDVESKDYIGKIASPVKLGPDTTRVRLLDYFEIADSIGSASLNNTKLQINKEGFAIVPPGVLQSPIGNLKVSYRGSDHDIIVFNTEKIKYTFTYKAEAPCKEVAMAGSMNGWNSKATPLKLVDGAWTTTLYLNPAVYEYRLWKDGKESMDETNPNQKSNGMGAFNNTFIVGNPDAIAARLFFEDTKDASIIIGAVGDVTEAFAYLGNKKINTTIKDGKVHVQIPNTTTDRAFVRVYGTTGNLRTNDVLIPLNKGKVIESTTELNRKDLHTNIMYFMMVDRFFDGNNSNNRPTNDPAILPKANNFGGDIKGITEKIKSGYFKEMGMNTIWISPISRNAEGAWGLWNKGAISKFSAYHGYWPTALTKIDDRFGSEQEFKELLDVAHQNNMNVVLDYVAHHVHTDHPLYKQHPEWTTPLYLPDGRMNTELWDEQRLTTWFDTFLPTWDFSKPEVVEALTDTALFWVDNYDLDGFRHDATKHIPEAFWQSLTAKIKKRENKSLFQIGETYGNPELISSYITSGQLDAQFDFNLYDAMVDAFAKDETGFENLQRTLNQSLYVYGSHHLMGNITGNQDRARFISYADGSVQFSDDPKLVGWTKDIQNNGKEGFKKLAMLNAFLMTTPGIPCVYYGDEIGLPGANDPDNRRMMVFENLNEDQSQLKQTVQKLAKLRQENMALIYGDIIPLKADNSVFAFLRKYKNKVVLVVFCKPSLNTESIELELPKSLSMNDLKSLIGNNTLSQKDGKLLLNLKDSDLVKNGFGIFAN